MDPRAEMKFAHNSFLKEVGHNNNHSCQIPETEDEIQLNVVKMTLAKESLFVGWKARTALNVLL